MNRILLDTNVLAHFFLQDIAEQGKEIRRIFTEAQEGKRTVIVLPIVIAEMTFVLRSVYKNTPKHIAEILQTFLCQKWIEVEDRIILLKALKHYEEGMHFVDAYLFARSEQNNEELFTFDKKLAKRSKK